MLWLVLIPIVLLGWAIGLVPVCAGVIARHQGRLQAVPTPRSPLLQGDSTPRRAA